MNADLLLRLQRLYKKNEQLLKSGKFGQGLWPLDPFLGQFLAHLIVQHDLKHGVEIGAGVGYSSGWLGAGFLETGGKVTSLEYFLPKVKQWEWHVKSLFGTDYEKTVQIVPSDFRKWIRHVGRQKFDFVFLDHRKNEYLESLLVLLPHLKKGAFVCADNVLSHPQECAEYLKFVRGHKAFASVPLEIGQGLEISRFLAC
ncbi:MAG: O-methyltransferase [Candidatus Altimarinota bacterium]